MYIYGFGMSVIDFVNWQLFSIYRHKTPLIIFSTCIGEHEIYVHSYPLLNSKKKKFTCSYFLYFNPPTGNLSI